MQLLTSLRSSFFALLVILSLIPGHALARDLYVAPPASPRILAFARYIASMQQRNPSTESGPVLVEIEASLPGLYKQSRLLAIGQTGSERREYKVLGIAGDATVTREVIVRYLALRDRLEDL